MCMQQSFLTDWFLKKYANYLVYKHDKFLICNKFQSIIYII